MSIEIDKEAEQAFYEALGPDLNELVVLCDNGISVDGFFSIEQLNTIQQAYTNYLQTPKRDVAR